jgi:site-specific recombinase XerD
LRHLYITDALENGMSLATVAELVGHRDLKMVMQIYSHLSERADHLRDAARTALPAAPGPPPPTGR